MADALPNLVVIGAQKCGTSSLHRYLDLHPAIAMSKPKELKFFVHADPTEERLAWYTHHFRADAPIRGESSPVYTYYPFVTGVPERMHGLIPEARLIYMVRDPIERAVSEYLHLKAREDETRPIEQALSDPDSSYVWRGRYFTQLQLFLAHYPLARVLVLDQRDLLERRAETMNRVFTFLGVDASFTSPEFGRMWEVSKGKGRKFTLLYKASRAFGGPRVWAALPTRLRWLGERVALSSTASGKARPMLDDAVRARLVELFSGEARQLRELTGERFASWSV